MGYIPGNSPLLTIYDPQGTPTDLIWFPVQGRFGPINCSQIGVEVEATGNNQSDPILGVVFDGGVSLGVLDVELDQLSLAVHLKEVADISGYSLDLQGLAVSFNTGVVQLSGGLFKTTHSYDGTPYIAYDGEALLKAEDITLSALGSYASIPDGVGTSLFIFAMLNAPIGGPPFFAVTGLAAGFGYNRSLKIPSQDQVQDFPLLAGLANTSLIGGSNPSPQTVLSSLEDWVPPEAGEYWLAAGLQFTTFEVINSNALLIVEFGQDFIVSVLGISTLKQPPAGTTYAYAELDIEVVFDPGQGEILASAVLAPSSYVLTTAAHLTGGFAFYSWFGDNAHSGDFVFTIGGYHPAFVVPSYYPQEARVGFNWQVNSEIAIIGGAYFAITPTAMMAGGQLSVTYHTGPLKAWLEAQADAIIFWKPFYLIADASISVGVSYRIHVLFVDTTLTVEIGADLNIWGPPTGGSVHISWYIISFTIHFGVDGPKSSNDLTWEEFKGLLPGKPPVQQANPASRTSLALATDADASTPAYLTIKANAGLKTTGTLDGLSVWLVRAGQFQFSAVSAIPASSIVVQSQDSVNNQTIAGQPVAIRGVNGGISSSDYQSVQTLTILQLPDDPPPGQTMSDLIAACQATSNPCTTQPAGCQSLPINIAGWEVNAVVASLPQAMWGDPVPSGQHPDINPQSSTVSGTVGVTMFPIARDQTGLGTPVMDIETVFEPMTINPQDESWLPLSPTQQPTGQPPQEANSFADIAQANTSTTVANRNALFQALQDLGINGWTNNPLPEMAASPGADFSDEPMEGSPASNLS